MAPRIKNPHDVWAKMKADMDLDEDEMPEYLAKDIMAWDAGNAKSIPVGAQKPLPHNRPLNRSLNAEGVLSALLTQEWPERPMVARKCKSCGEVYKTTYKSNAYCSDSCRREGLKDYGIDWQERYSTKSEVEEWAGRVPAMVIPPAALRVMKFLVNEAEALQGAELIPWHPKTIARMNGPHVELVPEEELAPIQSADSSKPAFVQPSLKERLAALKTRNGLGN